MYFLIVVLVLLISYIYLTRNHNYWSKRNVKHDRPIPLFGNHLYTSLWIKNLVMVSTDLYKKYSNEALVGYYKGNTPMLLVRDPDIAKNILINDFSSFYKRGLSRDAKKEPLMRNLFRADDDSWKLLRQRLAPAFTNAKLKNMFPLIENCARKLQKVGDRIVTEGGKCELRELMARFTTEFIGACGFGIDMDTINNETSFFRELGLKIFKRSLKDIILLSTYELFPALRIFLRPMSKNLEKTLTTIFVKVREQRNAKPSGRNDFVDLLLELESLGKIVGKSLDKKNPDGTPVEVEMEFDVECMVAQAFIFFCAGLDTSSLASSVTIHHLAFHPEVQLQIQKEIDEVLQKHNNLLCFEAVAELKLLDMAFKESLRIFPPGGVILRKCSKRYTIPGTDVTIDPGVKIIIPIQGMHLDEKYFDKPNEFDPFRFSPNNEKDRFDHTYMPFGEGPRACIASKLGHMLSVVGVAALLSKFTVEPAAGSQERLEVDPMIDLVQGVKGGINVKLKPRF